MIARLSTEVNKQILMAQCVTGVYVLLWDKVRIDFIPIDDIMHLYYRFICNIKC